MVLYMNAVKSMKSKELERRVQISIFSVLKDYHTHLHRQRKFNLDKKKYISRYRKHLRLLVLDGLQHFWGAGLEGPGFWTLLDSTQAGEHARWLGIVLPWRQVDHDRGAGGVRLRMVKGRETQAGFELGETPRGSSDSSSGGLLSFSWTTISKWMGEKTILMSAEMLFLRK